MTIETRCPISGDIMTPAFSSEILGRHQAQYVYSEKSGLLQAAQPYWLDEAYGEAIARTDVGLAQRNLSNSEFLEVLLPCLGLGAGRLLDIAGGTGLLTRLMRDKGFDCFTTDKYCANQFAAGFEPDAGFQADALFAFEVLEHLEDPVAFLRDAFDRYRCRTLVFSTLTFEGDVPAKDWWYYTFDTGQHISFYQPRTLAMLAGKLGCHYTQLGPEMHIITDRRLPSLRLTMVRNPRLRALCGWLVRYRRRGYSKTWADYLLAKQALQDSLRERAATSAAAPRGPDHADTEPAQPPG